MTARRSARAVVVAAALVAFGAAGRAQAQQPTKPPPKKAATGQTVEIRGQAPTPQVVTVRPREVPEYAPASLPVAVIASGAWPSVSSA